MKAVIPELFNEQHLLKHMEDFYNDAKLCQMTLTSLSIEGYKTLKLPPKIMYTDGKYLMVEETKGYYSKAILYTLMIDDDTKEVSSKFYMDLSTVQYPSLLNKLSVKIVNNLIYILQYYNILIIDMKDKSSTIIDLHDVGQHYDSLDIINCKIYLTFNKEFITIYENEMMPKILQRDGHSITIQNGKILTYRCSKSILSIDELVNDEWVNRITVLFPIHEMSFFITYISENLAFICIDKTVHIFKDGKISLITLYGSASDDNNVIVDKYNKRLVINVNMKDYFTKIYDVKTQSMSNIKAKIWDFVYI
jgi:hypothetical protein